MDSVRQPDLQCRGACRHRWCGCRGGDRLVRPQRCRRLVRLQLFRTCRRLVRLQRFPWRPTPRTHDGGLKRRRRRRPLRSARPPRPMTSGSSLAGRVLLGSGPSRLHAIRVPRRRLPRPRRRLGGPLRPPRVPHLIRSGLPVDKVVGPLAFIAKAGLSNAMIPYFRFSEVAEEFLRRSFGPPGPWNTSAILRGRSRANRSGRRTGELPHS